VSVEGIVVEELLRLPPVQVLKVRLDLFANALRLAIDGLRRQTQHGEKGRYRS